VSWNAVENVSQILIAFSQLFDGGKIVSAVGAPHLHIPERHALLFVLTLSGFGKIVDA
jgi:hypothetical protein